MLFSIGSCLGELSAKLDEEIAIDPKVTETAMPNGDFRRLWWAIDGVVAPIALFVGIYLTLALAITLVGRPHSAAGSQQVALVAVALATLATILITRTKAPWLHWKRTDVARDALQGLLVPLLILSTADLLITLSSDRERSFVGAISTAELFALMLPAVVHEELLLRGLVFERLVSLNRLLGVGVTSLTFALLHANNAGLSAVALINLTLGGVLLGLLRLVRGTIWLPLIVHWCWNVMCGPILGYEVSGFRVQSLFVERDPGPTIITGGDFGLEGSIWVSVITVVAILAVGRSVATATAPEMVREGADVQD